MTPPTPEEGAQLQPWASYPIVGPTAPLAAREAVEQLSRAFCDETGLGQDHAYLARCPGTETIVALPTPFPAASARGGLSLAGAVAVEPETPHVSWVYVAPAYRGQRLVDRAWPLIVGRWPGIRWSSAITPAGARLIDRLTHPNG
ncbi:hypothetical protein [Streptomyces sp. NBRC 109706]|uniref:hypothetical protein n=1 Tax=Streptomyces sp. NBRC 109706 TaxID=1550035 RepID=UPI0007826DE5|nr:hypothetical protein [Streptomyces sp. NBRC 109706]